MTLTLAGPPKGSNANANGKGTDNGNDVATPWTLTAYEGDFLVHQKYGIGRFLGLQDIETVLNVTSGHTVKDSEGFLKKRGNILAMYGSANVPLEEFREQTAFNKNIHPDLYLPAAEFDLIYKRQFKKALNLEYRDGKLLVLCDRFGLARVSLFRSAFLTQTGERLSKARSIRNTRLSSLESRKSWQREIEKAEEVSGRENTKPRTQAVSRINIILQGSLKHMEREAGRKYPAIVR